MANGYPPQKQCSRHKSGISAIYHIMKGIFTEFICYTVNINFSSLMAKNLSSSSSSSSFEQHFVGHLFSHSRVFKPSPSLVTGLEKNLTLGDAEAGILNLILFWRNLRGKILITMRSLLASTKDHNGRSSRAQVYLNVYDLTPMNNYLYWVGLGIFHSGIEVHGMEYGFGAHEYSTSGVFEVPPKSCPGFEFRRSVSLGSTDMSRSDFQTFMEHLSSKYHGDTYHLIAKNCNHFTDDVCLQLTGKSIPGWVNRLARLGSFCNCLLPENIQVTTIRHLPDHEPFSEDESLSGASSADAESEDDDSDHHLLTTPNGDVAFLKDKPVKLARELL